MRLARFAALACCVVSVAVAGCKTDAEKETIKTMKQQDTMVSPEMNNATKMINEGQELKSKGAALKQTGQTAEGDKLISQGDKMIADGQAMKDKLMAAMKK
jgi:archaellum component FlaG (FlaF/FlaG flagellin family)